MATKLSGGGLAGTNLNMGLKRDLETKPHCVSLGRGPLEYSPTSLVSHREIIPAADVHSPAVSDAASGGTADLDFVDHSAGDGDSESELCHMQEEGAESETTTSDSEASSESDKSE